MCLLTSDFISFRFLIIVTFGTISTLNFHCGSEKSSKITLVSAGEQFTATRPQKKSNGDLEVLPIPPPKHKQKQNNTKCPTYP